MEERRLNHLRSNNEWRRNNREHVNSLARKYESKRLECNGEALKAYKRQQYQKHKEKYKEKSRLWRLGHKEKVKEYNDKNTRLRKIIRKSPKCIGCEILLKEKQENVCNWCIMRNNFKYMKLLGKRVIFREIDQKVDKKKSVILLSEDQKTKSPMMIAEVITWGHEVDLKKGQKIYINRSFADNMIWEEEKCYICLADDIIAAE